MQVCMSVACVRATHENLGERVFFKNMQPFVGGHTPTPSHACLEQACATYSANASTRGDTYFPDAWAANSNSTVGRNWGVMEPEMYTEVARSSDRAYRLLPKRDARRTIHCVGHRTRSATEAHGG